MEQEAFDRMIRAHWDNQPEYRKGLNDIQWARMQPKREDAAFYCGDVVRCRETGLMCIINQRNEGSVDSGWPVQYSVDQIPGVPAPNKRAWFYDGDLEMVEPSAARKFMALPKGPEDALRNPAQGE